MSTRSAATFASRPTLIDLYAGAGGLSLGMEQAGFDLVGAVEFDPIHAQTHRFNFPHTPVLCKDMSSVTANDIVTLARVGWDIQHAGSTFPGIDAIVGGPPCQGFSVGGVRDADDQRNQLFLKFVDLVVDLKPRVFCLENVAGLLEPRFDDIREFAFTRLATAGYSISGTEAPVNAVDYGVPQSRKRVLVLGALGRTAPTLEAASCMSRITVADALEGLPDPLKYRALLNTDNVVLTPDDLDLRSGTTGSYARKLSGLMPDIRDLSYPRAWDPSVLTSSLRTVHRPATRQRFERTSQGKVERKSRLYRLAEDGVSRTLRAGTGSDRGSHTSPRPIHPTKARVITVREAARIHGYPDWFRFHATNWHGHRQVGNSVPPPLAAAAGRALMKHVGGQGSRGQRSVALGDAAWLTHGRTLSLSAIQIQDGPAHGEAT